MKKRITFFLSLSLILVGSCYFFQGIVNYLIFVTELPVPRFFSPLNHLNLSGLFLSYCLIIFGYAILKRNDKVLRLLSLLFLSVWAIYFFFQLVLNKIGLYLGSFYFYFPQTRPGTVLFCLDMALSLWVAPNIINRVVTSLLEESDSRKGLLKESAAVYVGTFLIALSTLALEITLTRLLSVITWYHLAFFVVSTAMMGMTAGAITIYLMKPKWFTESNLNGVMAMASMAYALVIPVTLVLLCRTSMGTGTTFLGLLPMTFTCTLPFYFSGMVITMVLTKCRLPIGQIYASDLTGAGLGCLFVMVGLEVLDAPSFVLSCGVVALAGASSFAWSTRFYRLRRWIAFLFLCITLLLISSSLGLIQGSKPMFVKGSTVRSADILIDHWNSYSRVVVFKNKGQKQRPQYWGASSETPKDERIYQYHMNIDGAAATALRRFNSIDDVYHLRYDVTNIVYYLRPRGGTCIIGIGGARDLQSAIMFGHEKVIGIDINPIFVDLLENRFRDFAGIADRKGVTLVSAEARSFLSKFTEKYSVIQMSLIDTWAATGAGAFTLSENALYTREAWKIFLDRLDENGIFTVSRWYHPERPGETGRLISLATAALLDRGIKDPSRHMAMIPCGSVATLLLSTHPFSNEDIAILKRVCEELKFDPVILPGSPCLQKNLEKIISADSFAKLSSAIEDKPLNYAPPTDETPYFFNMLKLNHLKYLLPSMEAEIQRDYSEWSGGVVYGNLAATLTLAKLILCLLFLTIITVIFPLSLKKRLQKENDIFGTVLWSGAAYFSLIGAGFMIAEIALLQRLSVFLGHPLYALGILLCTLITSAGAGSFFSERLPLTAAPWVFVYPIIVSLGILSLVFVLPFMASNMISSSTATKSLAAVMVIAPIGLLMGVCFPTGMRLVRLGRTHETPWYWALNGIFSVLCSPIAVFISIYFSISTNFWISALCYMMLLLLLPGMRSAVQGREITPG